MINKRLTQEIKDSSSSILYHVFFQWSKLVANIVLMWQIGAMIEEVVTTGKVSAIPFKVLACMLMIGVRFATTIGANRMAFASVAQVKGALRDRLYKKLLEIGPTYHERIDTAAVLQVAVEGIEQIETYVGRYLPQFYYSMLAPLTLFVVLITFSPMAAFVLLVCVPLIPLSIIVFQKFAKKIVKKYWGKYTQLGDIFLENLQGLTTLKIYGADEKRHEGMNKAAQEFREVTMKVLSMQLNSIILMNGIAFGGAALAIIMSIYQYSQGSITLTQAFMILVLGAEFFIPLRILGSYFHVAMNGNAACNQLFEILDEEETEKPEPMPTKESYKEYAVVLDHVNFSYTPQKQTLQDVSMRVKEKEFVAMVGKSGCGKSTIAAVVAGQLEGYEGDIYFNERQSKSLSKKEKLRKVMCINHNSYIFKGTIKENLRMGNEVATEAQMLEALERVRLKDFILNQGGLSFQLLEEGSNLSGGQKQRLAIARALLRDAQIYLFDEATSNIDQESEEAILEVIHELAKVKTVILISHCLQNVIKADCIYMMEEGQIKEVGNHQALLEKRGLYMDLYERQKQLEKEVKGGEDIA